MRNRFPRVGVIGAGHLARMMVAPATALGVDLLLFAADSNDSGAQITHHVVGDYTNLAQLLEFAKEVDLVTYESDQIPQSIVKGLEAAGVKVYPSSISLGFLDNLGKIEARIFRFQDPGHRREIPGHDSAGDDHLKFGVLVARSPHGQATSWVPANLFIEGEDQVRTISPAQEISPSLSEKAQQLALEIAQIVGVVGVMRVKLCVHDEEIFLNDIGLLPDESGNWTIEGSTTSQYEQHLRAILDLPLGSPAINHKYVVTGKVFAGEKGDMYRPYLHLMARNPKLHFHQYRNEAISGAVVGHITACGDDLLWLKEEIDHACAYMSGLIDE